MIVTEPHHRALRRRAILRSNYRERRHVATRELPLASISSGVPCAMVASSPQTRHVFALTQTAAWRAPTDIHVHAALSSTAQRNARSHVTLCDRHPAAVHDVALSAPGDRVAGALAVYLLHRPGGRDAVLGRIPARRGRGVLPLRPREISPDVIATKTRKPRLRTTFNHRDRRDRREGGGLRSVAVGRCA